MAELLSPVRLKKFDRALSPRELDLSPFGFRYISVGTHLHGKTRARVSIARGAESRRSIIMIAGQCAPLIAVRAR